MVKRKIHVGGGFGGTVTLPECKYSYICKGVLIFGVMEVKEFIAECWYNVCELLFDFIDHRRVMIVVVGGSIVFGGIRCVM